MDLFYTSRIPNVQVLVLRTENILDFLPPFSPVSGNVFAANGALNTIYLWFPRKRKKKISLESNEKQ